MPGSTTPLSALAPPLPFRARWPPPRAGLGHARAAPPANWRRRRGGSAPSCPRRSERSPPSERREPRPGPPIPPQPLSLRHHASRSVPRPTPPAPRPPPTHPRRAQVARFLWLETPHGCGRSVGAAEVFPRALGEAEQPRSSRAMSGQPQRRAGRGIDSLAQPRRRRRSRGPPGSAVCGLEFPPGSAPGARVTRAHRALPAARSPEGPGTSAHPPLRSEPPRWTPRTALQNQP